MSEPGQKMTSADWNESVTRWEEAYNRGDAAAVGTLYSEQVAWCGTMTGMLKGRAAIATALQTMMDRGLKTVKVEAVEGETQGHQTYVVTRFQSFGANGGQPLFSGSALSIAERQGSELLIHHHWAVGDPQPK